MARLEGIRITLNGREYVMPRLTMGIVRKEWPHIVRLRRAAEIKGDDAETEEKREAAIMEMGDRQMSMLAAALRRNYPEVTDEQVMDWLEVGALQEAFDRLMRFSQFGMAAEVAAGAGDSPGEA